MCLYFYLSCASLLYILLFIHGIFWHHNIQCAATDEFWFAFIAIHIRGREVREMINWFVATDN